MTLKQTEEEKELKRLANTIIGSVNLKKHPEWATKKKVNAWVRKLRSEWQ